MVKPICPAQDTHAELASENENGSYSAKGAFDWPGLVKALPKVAKLGTMLIP